MNLRFVQSLSVFGPITFSRSQKHLLKGGGHQAMKSNPNSRISSI